MWASTVHFSVTPRFLHGKNEEHYLGDTAEMKCSPGFVTVVLLMLGETQGNSVTQTEGQVTLSEKTSLTINCTYSTTGSPTLFWYVQHPSEGLQLLLRAFSDKKESNKGFEATLDSKSKSFHLEKGSVQASDSAVYYCVMNDTVTGTAGGAERKL
uniref:Ig-like domain-containing protein n=1 Tax=Ursus maritimus TaxID=29073 RepID=A0A452TYJ4_URSMA